MSEYYNFYEDRIRYPDAWLYIIYSGRGPGKTYSTLWDCVEHRIPFGYIKRTQDDIELITKPEFSPFKPINRDKGTDIKSVVIGGGLNRFIDGDGSGIGYALAMSAVHKYKGFDLSEIDHLIFDEFIPQKSERVNRKEGELLLDLYLTIARDRVQRGRNELKLIMLANSTNLACPVLLTLGLVDLIADLQAQDIDEYYNPERKIYIHHITHTPSVQQDSGLLRTMSGSAWAQASLTGSFVYNDYSAIKKLSVKGSFPVCAFIWNGNTYYVWRNRNSGIYYCCASKTNNNIPVYDLESEISAKRFWLEYGITLKAATVDGKMYYSTYSGYDLIFNFIKRFEV